MMNKARVLIGMILLLPVLAAGLVACTDEEPVRVDLSKREALVAPRQVDAITYAYLPQYSHTISYQRHRRMLEYLRQTTGLPLRQIFPDTFDEHIKMVERGEIDISYSNPFVYVRLAKAGAQAFARVIEPSGEPNFRGQIITRSDNAEIRDIADCRGKRWVAVDPDSAGGYLFPLGLFFDNGIQVEDFETVDFAPGPGGKQEKVVLSVYAGVYDIGTIRKGTLDVVGGKIDLGAIRVLAETRAYPGWVYSARKGLDPEVVEAISKAMFALDHENEAHKLILSAAGIRGVIPAKDIDYGPVRELAEKLGLDR
ncbi:MULTISPECIES: phosphate/phosphite/phosphonate ABC transporter substrate-binding protein [unclassified Pseudodesulfovibrio]|uniref:phosphate/phosphite/phosphonate ABC transporter substrate-binding protein n=1 Tax=unclassified Pseudodesulfovibrio TaxID=2661612 RepID=UPI000FEB9859|nr:MULTISPECIES: phosphate/phosphite/phosphonate ABC transporter substrate-binding protein [unclassified Pseudodesulfovibrio]MCJ2163492.1 phosphate/phosphite/phosphonate ABC transporter substrate-binding protein [Pseudodesulfovibrio sp. S3-i]RWU06727.1 phosphate/phosphite/phosphonate ABC transporter substrate-binding protein [Pseudodesulfovibrio sp. S3]